MLLKTEEKVAGLTVKLQESTSELNSYIIAHKKLVSEHN
jgi:hypothetical protein